MVNLNNTPGGSVTALDIDAHLEWKRQPLPAEACTEIGAEPAKWSSREREYRNLIALVTLPWALVIGAVQLWQMLASFF